MNLSITISIFLFLLLNAMTQALADTVYLKSGYQMEGIVKRETDEYVELEINSGAVKFYREQIEQVEYSSEEEKKMIEESWKKESLKKQAELKSRQQEEVDSSKEEINAGRSGNHLFVKVLINRSVKAKLLIDTGSSLVMLSPGIVRQLNIGVAGYNPDVSLRMADGRELPGKLIKLDTISIGENTANDVDAAVIYREDAFGNYDGLLGMSFLKLFKFEINLEENKFILEKNTKPQEKKP